MELTWEAPPARPPKHRSFVALVVAELERRPREWARVRLFEDHEDARRRAQQLAAAFRREPGIEAEWRELKRPADGALVYATYARAAAGSV